MSRLRGFLFIVFRRDGEREHAIFWASSARDATKYAREWAQRLGHRRVELVEDEVAA